MGNSDSLAVMLKSPFPGKVKTRLCPPLSPLQACRLYEFFIADIFASVVKLKGVDIFVAYTPPEAENKITGLIPRGVPSFPQEGASLGERIYNVFKVLFEKGYKRSAVIGSDSPDMPLTYIKEAFKSLDGSEANLVLGPARDGGYCLIAMDSLFDSPFVSIPWSTGDVLEETIKRARENSIRFKLLRPWHDIDTAEDLKMLKDSKKAPRSSHYLKSIGIL